MDTSLELSPGRIADSSGALYLERTRTLMIADAHLGYGWAQRRRGQMGPVGDGGIRERLTAVVNRYQPSEIVFLGDTVHAPRPSAPEREFIEAVLGELVTFARVTVVRGNHDRAFGRDFGDLPIALDTEWRDGDMLGLHGDRLHLEIPEASHYLLGHLHPAVSLFDDAGVRMRVPAFLVSERATILPAFSPFASGFDITRLRLPKEVRTLLGNHETFVATGKRIAKLPSTPSRTVR